jgi:hypothetical protein
MGIAVGGKKHHSIALINDIGIYLSLLPSLDTKAKLYAFSLQVKELLVCLMYHFHMYRYHYLLLYILKVIRTWIKVIYFIVVSNKISL